MSTVSLRSIESLWFEPGTAADAAACANRYSSELHYTPDIVRRIWSRAQEQGRLPDLNRPNSGFQGFMSPVMKRLGEIMAGRVKA